MGYTTEFEGRWKITMPSAQIEDKSLFLEDKSLPPHTILPLSDSTEVSVGNGKTVIDDLSPIQCLKFINLISETRRMKRDISKLGHPNPSYFGVEGEFYIPIKDLDSRGQGRDDSILEYNQPPKTQPGLWLGWQVVYDEKDGHFYLEWDEVEKFYYYEEWLKYLIENIFEPKGMSLNGKVSWSGEDSSDVGNIIIVDNNIEVFEFS